MFHFTQPTLYSTQHNQNKTPVCSTLPALNYTQLDLTKTTFPLHILVQPALLQHKKRVSQNPPFKIHKTRPAHYYAWLNITQHLTLPTLHQNITQLDTTLPILHQTPPDSTTPHYTVTTPHYTVTTLHYTKLCRNYTAPRSTRPNLHTTSLYPYFTKLYRYFTKLY